MSTHERLTKLIQKGPNVYGTRTGTYYPFTETNPDGKGGRIAKLHDVQIHDQTVEQSKFKEGPGWQRGFKN